VVSAAFSGLNTLKKQRLVFGAIKELMAGDNAPVHAIDRMITEVPA
jgi:stress-induced morphogen